MARFSFVPGSRRPDSVPSARMGRRAPAPRSSGSVPLDRRRLADLLRRAGTAGAAALLMWSLVSLAVSMHGTRRVVVAATHIARGATIGAGDLTVRTVAADTVLDAAFDTVDQVVGLTALVDMGAGHPVLTAMARAAPVPREGETVVGVPLASSASQFVAGDEVRLLSSACPQGADGQGDAASAPDVGTGADAEGSSGERATYTRGSCVVVPRATVIEVPAANDGMDSPLGMSGAVESHDGTAMTRLAMDPDAALTALSLRESAPIVAVPLAGGG